MKLHFFLERLSTINKEKIKKEVERIENLPFLNHQI